MAIPKVDLVSWFNKASRIPRGTHVLDRVLWRVVPFNASVKPHVVRVAEDEIVTEVPLRRGVMNHLGSMHAAVLVTVAEYSQGLLIVANAGKLGADLILANLTIDYKAKGKGTVRARAEMTQDIRDRIKSAIERGENIPVELHSTLTDKKTGEVLAVCTGQWKARRKK